MVEQLSPLAPVWRPGSHGDFGDGVGVVFSETQPGSIVQLAAWPGEEETLIRVVAEVTGLAIPDAPGAGVATDEKAVFGIAPGKFLAVDQEEGLAARLSALIGAHVGSVTDLSHGRTAIRVAGQKAEWVLSKFFAIDFALAAFPVGSGVSTVHHDFFAQIQRSGDEQLDVYVFRSFARSFWTALCHGSEEVGYEVK